MHSPHLLGILGGLGPMASAFFYEMITEHTRASSDQEHIDIILSSRASTPDRTDFILGRSDESPLPAMIEDARALEAFGARTIAFKKKHAYAAAGTYEVRAFLSDANAGQQSTSISVRIR